MGYDDAPLAKAAEGTVIKTDEVRTDTPNGCGRGAGVMTSPPAFGLSAETGQFGHAPRWQRSRLSRRLPHGRRRAHAIGAWLRRPSDGAGERGPRLERSLNIILWNAADRVS